MNIETSARKDVVVPVVGLLVLLLGVATGSAIAMLVMSVVGLAGISILYRKQLGWTVWAVVALSVSVSFAAAIGMTMFD